MCKMIKIAIKYYENCYLKLSLEKLLEKCQVITDLSQEETLE